MSNTDELKQYCTFTLDGNYFGIDVLEVQEVFRYQEMTSIPLSTKMTRGLINLRGQIITALDLRCRLGLPDADEDHIPMNVVVRTSDEVISLLVDEIGDVVQISEDKYESPPETLAQGLVDLVTGVYKLEGKLLLILDTEKVTNGESIAA